jgi:hypothetical protein
VLLLTRMVGKNRPSNRGVDHTHCGAGRRRAHSHGRSDGVLQLASDCARILAQLKETNGRHLVTVRYGPVYTVEKEWVYNEADIDGGKIVWARETDSAPEPQTLGVFQGPVRVAGGGGKDGSSPEVKPYPVNSVS